MKITYKTGSFSSHKTKVLVIGCFEGKKNDGIKFFDGKLNKTISKSIHDKTFEGKINQILNIPTQGNIGADYLFVVGFGKKNKFTLDALRQVSGSAISASLQVKAKELSIGFLDDVEKIFSVKKIAQAIVEGACLSSYRFNTYKTDKKLKEESIDKIVLLSEKKIIKKEIDEGIKKGKNISDAVFFARDLVSHPGNSATPTYLSTQAMNMSKKYGIHCKILNEKDIKQLKMGAFLSVSRGSSEAPKFIICEYFGKGKKVPPYLFVGKGVTFDSGGISLKPGKGMQEMKFDMAGGAAAAGAIMAAAALNLPVNVVSLIPATENMPSGTASKPGDVLHSMSGKTIEVISTDAEGRLIMADALTYAKRYKPKAVIDIATLTGACIVALGHAATAALGNDEKLISALKAAGNRCGEKLWELPLWDEYSELIKSNIADIKNVGDGTAGVITAAGFLSEFAKDFNWVHLDIAGTAWENKGKPYTPKGASGVGVRLLVEFLENICEKNQ